LKSERKHGLVMQVFVSEELLRSVKVL